VVSKKVDSLFLQTGFMGNYGVCMSAMLLRNMLKLFTKNFLVRRLFILAHKMKEEGMGKICWYKTESNMDSLEVSRMVKILFYTSAPKQFGTEITCMLALSAENLFEFQSVYNTDNLKQLLQNELTAEMVVILAALSHSELDELLQLRQRYDDLPVILLLADDTDETLKIAHRFRPKFLTTVHHDFTYVMSVVEKLCKGLCSYLPLERRHVA